MDKDILLLLEKQYCPPLDSALFSAIASDYDLSDNASTSELRATLDVLKESVEAEENTAFDPSGSSSRVRDTSPHESTDRAQSWHGDATSRSEETDLTSACQSVDSFGIGDDGDAGRRVEYDKGLEELSLADKEATLKEMFPHMKPFDINYTLKKTGNNFGKTFEDLLNQVFFDEADARSSDDRILKKGIDAFADNNAHARKSRGKRKKQAQLLRRTSSTPSALADKSPNSPRSTPIPSRWDLAAQDVDFITQRTYLDRRSVASTYHKSGGSLSSTIAALCTNSQFSNPYITPKDDPTLQTHAIELSSDFPTLPQSHLIALITLTHPSTASAHELARALLTHPSAITTTTTLTPQYLPPTVSPPSSPTHTPEPPPTLPLTKATHLATLSTRAHHTALTQASIAHRASKSNPLMSGAASHYSSVSRASALAAAHYSAAAATARVDAQSTALVVDLHGVSVKDAVRIARERVQGWWGSGGQEWAREGRVLGGGLRVVTGVGRHSEGGVGRLGPAVGGMLVREGWRVEVGEGVVEVVGRRRR